MAHLTNQEATHFMDELARVFPHDRAILERTPLGRPRTRMEESRAVEPKTRVYVVRLIKSIFWPADIQKLQELVDDAGKLPALADGYGFSWQLQELVSSDQRGQWHLPSPAFTITKT